jgi:hypothetical protein
MDRVCRGRLRQNLDGDYYGAVDDEPVAVRANTRAFSRYAPSVESPTVNLQRLDRQLLAVRSPGTELPALSEAHWQHLATVIYGEASSLIDEQRKRLKADIAIPVTRYIEEMVAFQAWMEIATTLRKEPAIVRAQVITQLYVSFIWLRDSLLEPVSAMLPGTVTRTTIEFLSTGRRRHLRNAVAHGRWTYLPDFGGLEAWNKGHAGVLARDVIASAELDAWQTLARGTSIAVLLSLEP